MAALTQHRCPMCRQSELRIVCVVDEEKLDAETDCDFAAVIGDILDEVKRSGTPTVIVSSEARAHMVSQLARTHLPSSKLGSVEYTRRNAWQVAR